MEKLTCQVCGRAVRAASGLIAHHGYSRPGYGWQTASCAGARYVPYQVSCDRLKEIVEVVKNFIAAQEQALAEFVANPPAQLSVWINKSAYQSGKEIVCDRPADLDTKSYGYRVSSGMPRTYEYAHSGKINEYERNIRFAKADLVEMEQRVVEWARAAGEGRTIPAPKTVSTPRVKKAPKPVKTFRCFIEKQPEFEEQMIEATSYQKAKEVYEKFLKAQDERKYYRAGAYFDMKAKEVK